MSTLITKNEMESLLGRSLTSLESKNYALNLDIAVSRLVSILCLPGIPEEITDARMKLLLARIFGLKTEDEEYSRRFGIGAKQVEDFRVTYKDEAETPAERLMRECAADIAELTKCRSVGRSGKVSHGYRFYPI